MRVDGWRRFRAALALAATALLAAGCASLPHDPPRTPSTAIAASVETELGRIAAASAGDPALSGFRLMSWSEQSFETRLALAARAQRSLDVQYYVFDDDGTGRMLMRALRDAAARGVRVRLLLDDLYTGGNDPLLLALAAHPNVEIRLFNPFMVRYESVAARIAASLLEFGRVNHRMHNKLFIADGAMAVAGGRNIGDEYFMAAPRRQLHRPRRVRGRRGAAEAGEPVRRVLEQRARLSARDDRAGARAGRGAPPPLRAGDRGAERAAVAGARGQGHARPARDRRGAGRRPARADLGEGGGLRRLARQGHRSPGPRFSASRRRPTRPCARA